MEKPTLNRLQFVHCEKLFATREEAIAYVDNVDEGDKYGRPALYAEPMILKYGSEEEPDILLAIGSVGDGVTKKSTNKTYFIDFSLHKAQIAEIFERLAILEDRVDELEDALEELKAEFEELYIFVHERELHVDETDTVALTLTDPSETGITLTADVKKAETYVVENTILDKNIIVSNEQGLFAQINLAYSGNGDTLKLLVNGVVQEEIELPTEIHLVKGDYNSEKEELELTLSNDEVIIVDVRQLAGEYHFDEKDESKTPFYFTVERRLSSDLDKYGDEVYYSQVGVNARIADVSNNILKVHGNGTTDASLYVKGTADNIKYKDITVEEGIDNETKERKEADAVLQKNIEAGDRLLQENIDDVAKRKTLYVEDSGTFDFEVKEDANGTFLTGHVKVQDTPTNIIRNDGKELFATVDLTYDTGTNTLSFVSSNNKGFNTTKKIALNSVELAVDKAYYESATEELVIVFLDENKKPLEVRIPVGDVIREWEVDNTNATVTLTKTLAIGEGLDTLTANVNVSDAPSNILMVDANRNLYVSNEQITANTKAIVDEVARAKDAEEKLQTNINEESTRAIKAESELQTALNNEISRATVAEQNNANAIKAESERAKDAENGLQTALNSEVDRAEKAEEVLKDAILAEQTRAEKAETELQKNLDNAVTDVNNTIASTKDELKANILAEQTRAEKAETELQKNLDNETTRAKSAEEANAKSITDEVVRAKDAEAKLASDLADEVARAKTAEIANNESVANETKRAQEAEDALRGALNAEVDRANGAESDLQTALNSEVDRAEKAEEVLKDAILAEKTRAEKAETALQTAIDNEQTRAEGVEKALESKITANETAIANEVARAQGVENTLSEKVAEHDVKIIELRKDTDNLISEVDTISDKLEEGLEKIKSNKIYTNNSGSLNLTEDVTENGTTIYGYVKVSDAPDNIIVGGNSKEGTALYASINLEYNGTTNVLTLTKSNGEQKDITLNAGSIINGISYKDKALEINYTTSSGVLTSTTVPVADFFKEMTTDNTDGAVDITITSDESGKWIFSASANIADDPNQAIKKVDNTLFVSNNAKDYYLANGTSVEDAIATLGSNEEALQNAIDAEVTRAKNAEKSLDDKIGVVSGKTVELSNSLTTLTNQVGTNTSDIAALKTRMDTAEGNINTNKTDIAALKATVAGHTSDINNLDGRVTTNTTNIGKNASEISDLKSRVSKNEGNIATLSGNVTTNTSDIANLKVSATTNSNNISALGGRLDTAETNISANTTEISNLKSRVSKNEGDIATLSGKVTTNTTDISNLKTSATTNASNISALSARLGTAEGNINNNSSRIDALSTRLGTAEGNINTLSGKVTTNTTNIATNTANIKSNSDKIAALDTRVGNNTTEINNLKTRMTTAEGNIATNTTEISNLKGRVSKNEGDIANLTTQVNKNTTDISNLKTSVAGNTSDITNLKGRMTTVEGSLTTINGNIANINNTITGLDSRFVFVSGDTMTGNLNVGSVNISTGGTITASGAVYSSDRTLKENIKAIEADKKAQVASVEAKAYNFIADEKKTVRYGVIAQELEEAGLNELVYETPDGKKGVDYISYLILKIAQLEDEIKELKNNK